jgi:hypothetical protein
MAPLPQLSSGYVTLRELPFAERIRGTMSQILFWRSPMSLSKLFLIVALICFILEALGNRVGFKSPVGLLGAGLAFWVASLLF